MALMIGVPAVAAGEGKGTTPFPSFYINPPYPWMGSRVLLAVRNQQKEKKKVPWMGRMRGRVGRAHCTIS